MGRRRRTAPGGRDRHDGDRRQSDRPQRVTFATDELGGTRGGRTASTPIIPAKATGRLTINAREGQYAVSVRDKRVRGARVFVGPPRESGQNKVLLP